jgi:hypothetical protein
MNDNKLTLSQDINQLHANICSAISEPNRIFLLYAVHEKPRNDNNLAEIVVSLPSNKKKALVLNDEAFLIPKIITLPAKHQSLPG